MLYYNYFITIIFNISVLVDAKFFCRAYMGQVEKTAIRQKMYPDFTNFIRGLIINCQDYLSATFYNNAVVRLYENNVHHVPEHPICSDNIRQI